MKITLFSLILLFTLKAASAQDRNFDLSKYKFPDYKRHLLKINFYSNGNSERNYSDTPRLNSNSSSITDELKLNMNANVFLIYNFENLQRKKIENHNILFIGDFKYLKNKNYAGVSTESTPHFQVNAKGFKRFYLTEDKWFIEGIYDLNFNTASRIISYSSIVADDDYKSNSLRVLAGGGSGFGRIEQVGDLFQSYYLLQKLSKKELLNRDLNDSDCFEFAHLISKLKNKRFFDFRFRKIAEIQALDSMLHKTGLVVNNDIAYFTMLNDYWSYGNFYNRKSGKQMKFNLSPEFSYVDYHSNNYSDSPMKTYLYSELKYENSKQLNLFWERNIYLEARNNTLIAKNDEVAEKIHRNYFLSSAKFELGFFPDSRTHLELKAGYSGYERINENNLTATKNWVNTFSFSFDAFYFISPRLQISCSFNSNLWFSEKNSKHGNNMNYNLGLNYEIF